MTVKDKLQSFFFFLWGLEERGGRKLVRITVVNFFFPFSFLTFTEGQGDQPTTYTALLNDLEISNPKLLGKWFQKTVLFTFLLERNVQFSGYTFCEPFEMRNLGMVFWFFALISESLQWYSIQFQWFCYLGQKEQKKNVDHLAATKWPTMQNNSATVANQLNSAKKTKPVAI